MQPGTSTSWDPSSPAAAPDYWSGADAGAAAPAPPSRLAEWLRALTAPRKRRIKGADVVLFVRHLSTVLNAGLPLAKGLRTVARQLENPALAQVVDTLSDSVHSGEMLSSAMALMPGVFDPLTVNVVRAGEVGGTLPRTLGQLAEDLEKKLALRRAVLGALVYPAVVVGIASVVVGFLLAYVVPTFSGVYEKMHLELPFITRMMLLLSDVLVRYWWVLVLVLATAAAVFRRVRHVESVRRGWELLLLRLPVLGKVRRGALAVRFLGTFSTLIGSGVSVVATLRLMAELSESLLLREATEEIRRHVSRGGTLCEPMERYAFLFTPMAVQMVSVGEQTGSLAESTIRTANFLAADVDGRVKTMTTLIEPLMTVGLGLVVGTIVLAIYLPMFDLMKHISH